jgi:hypothetical protein
MAATDYDFTATRNQIIEAAYRKIGALGRTQVLSGEQLEAGAFALNEIVKSLENDDLFLWTLRSVDVTCAVSQAVYDSTDMGTDPPVQAIDQATVKDNDDDLPLKVIPWREYLLIVNKEDTGQPTTISWDHSTQSFALYPTPDDDYDITLSAITPLKDWDTAAGAADFPVRFQLALIYKLAHYLGEDEGCAESEITRLEANSQIELGKAKAKTRDRATSECVKGAY